MKLAFPLFLSITIASSLFAAGGIGDYTYTDSLSASKSHPGNDSIALKDVPMFISFGFDDNGIADKGKGGTTWIRNYLREKTNLPGSGNPQTFDGTPIRAAFYLTAKYGNEWVYENYPDVRELWNKLYLDGHEIGNHSTNHLMFVKCGIISIWMDMKLETTVLITL